MLINSIKENAPDSQKKSFLISVLLDGLQKNRNNIPSESISDYFKRVVTIPFLDHLTVEIGRRYDHASISIYSGLVIILSKMMSLVYENVNWREKLLFIC